MRRARRAHRALAALAALAIYLLLCDVAAGHLGNLSYSEITVDGERVFYKLKFAAHLIPDAGPGQAEPLTRAEILAAEGDILDWLADTIRVQDGTACTPRISGLAGPDGNADLIVALEYACTEAVDRLRVEFHAFDGLVRDFQNIVSVRMAEQTYGYVFTPGSPVLIVDGPSRRPTGGGYGGFREFFELGVERIWTRYDHLLFLLALFLPGGSLWQIAAVVAAFTVAHSITLSLAAFGLVTLPSGPVEIAIAASIVYAAADGLRSGGADHRWRIAFAFGLVHGFGVASILTKAGLGAGTVTVPLLAFNLGVEAGQLAFVLVTIPVLRLLLRGRRARPLRLGLTWAVIASGVFWLAERATALLQ